MKVTMATKLHRAGAGGGRVQVGFFCFCLFVLHSRSRFPRTPSEVSATTEKRSELQAPDFTLGPLLWAPQASAPAVYAAPSKASL